MRPSSSSRSPRFLSSSTTLSSDDEDLVRRANEFISEEQVLRAARLLRMVQNPSLFSESQKKLLCNAGIIEYVGVLSVG
jgi:hypothetical protein